MTKIFWWIANGLVLLAKKLGLTYNEVNIIVYYLIVPLSWVIMFDVIIKMPVTTPALICSWLTAYYFTHKHFSAWCDYAFIQSQNFLLWFRRIGWNYIVSSVIICVVLPLLIYGTLIYLLIK